MHSSAASFTKPKSLRREDKTLIVEWSDGLVSKIPIEKIRLACACAVCKELKVPLSPEHSFYPRATAILNLQIVGNYACGITWQDGHKSIFAFDRLREVL